MPEELTSMAQVTTSERDALSDLPKGYQVYNLDNNKLNVWNGTEWKVLSFE